MNVKHERLKIVRDMLKKGNSFKSSYTPEQGLNLIKAVSRKQAHMTGRNLAGSKVIKPSNMPAFLRKKLGL